jgi:tripartite-type tricarboxylate transporter receptor subunit TctC
MKTERPPAVLCVGAALLGACIAGAAHAAGPSSETAGYPNRPLRIVVGFSGVTGQSLVRLIAERLEPVLGQPIIVEPRPGASGNIASESVARAVPDGHTLLLAQATTTLLPATQGSRAVDPLRAFAPVMRLATQPLAVVAHRSLEVGDLGTLLAAARARPDRIEYATPGVGTVNHLSAAMLWSRANVQLLHVPYSNSGAMVKDLASGVVPAAFSVPATVEPFVKSGQLRMLAQTGSRRSTHYPDVPTVAEAGFPGFETQSWYGLVAPVGTPRAIVQRLHDEIAHILQEPALRERLVALGLDIAVTTPEGLEAIMRGELARWSEVVRSSGIDLTRQAEN